nr:histidine--trna ligase, cytoplasmic [Quercus suber]
MKLGGNVKGLIVDENGMDVLYLRKLEGVELKHYFSKVMFKPSYENEEEKKVDVTLERPRKSKRQEVPLRSEDSGTNHLKKVKPTFQVPNPTLYAVATDFTSLRLDSSTLDRLSLAFGVSALLDHELATLSAVSDVVVALSCEAIKANVAMVFNLMDFGDGFLAKEDIEVTSDMKVLLTGSKLVGKVETDSVSKIAKVHIGISLKYL